MLEHWMPLSKNRFSKEDFDFVAAALADESCRQHLAKLWKDPEGRQEILDLKEVFRCLIESTSVMTVTPRFYFYMLVRHTFLDADLADVSLADYVAGVLARRVGFGEGDPLEDVTRGFTHTSQFLSFISRSKGRMRFHLQVAAGDQFLVLTGLYPHFLKHRNARGDSPDLEFYENFAGNAYRMAAACPQSTSKDGRRVFGMLGESLPATRKSLNRLAEEFVFLGNE